MSTTVLHPVHLLYTTHQLLTKSKREGRKPLSEHLSISNWKSLEHLLASVISDVSSFTMWPNHRVIFSPEYMLGVLYHCFWGLRCRVQGKREMQMSIRVQEVKEKK